jgi:hypothetical protein
MVRSVDLISIFFVFVFFNGILCKLEIEELRFLSTLSSLSTETTNSSKGIRCFWLEPKHLSVYDLKGLKRPFGRK